MPATLFIPQTLMAGKQQQYIKRNDAWFSFLPHKRDYDDCAQFKLSDHCSSQHLCFYRALVAYWLTAQVVTTYWLNDDGILHQFFYFSYWGSIFTQVAFIACNKAAFMKKDY
jgi:hypothetical protein